MNYKAVITIDPANTLGPTISFYDSDYAGPRFTEHGQHVATYYISTLLERRAGHERAGLDLCGYVEKWKLTPEQMREVYQMIDEYVFTQEAHR